MLAFYFFFTDTPTTEIYSLSLHDALPILIQIDREGQLLVVLGHHIAHQTLAIQHQFAVRSEEHTSELQSRQYLVCRLLLEKKKETQRKTRRLQSGSSRDASCH